VSIEQTSENDKPAMNEGAKPPEGTRFHDELALTRWLVVLNSRQRQLTRAGIVVTIASGLLLAAVTVCLILDVGEGVHKRSDSPAAFDYAALSALVGLLAGLISLAWPRDLASRNATTTESLPKEPVLWGLIVTAFVGLALGALLALDALVESV
jgi:hypothetical protein